MPTDELPLMGERATGAPPVRSAAKHKGKHRKSKGGKGGKGGKAGKAGKGEGPSKGGELSARGSSAAKRGEAKKAETAYLMSLPAELLE